MKYKKFIAYVLTLLVVISTTPIRVGAAAYTVSGNTATAIEGTTSWTPSGGVGTATVDLKNGTLEFDGVPITTSSLGGPVNIAYDTSVEEYTTPVMLTENPSRREYDLEKLPYHTYVKSNSGENSRFTIAQEEWDEDYYDGDYVSRYTSLIINHSGTPTQYGLLIVPRPWVDRDHRDEPTYRWYFALSGYADFGVWQGLTPAYGVPGYNAGTSAISEASVVPTQVSISNSLPRTRSSTSPTLYLSVTTGNSEGSLYFSGRTPTYRSKDKPTHIERFNTPIYADKTVVIDRFCASDHYIELGRYPYNWNGDNYMIRTGAFIDNEFTGLSASPSAVLITDPLWVNTDDHRGFDVSDEEQSTVAILNSNVIGHLGFTPASTIGHSPVPYDFEFKCAVGLTEVQRVFNVPQVSNVVGAKQINNITLKNCSSNNQTFDSAYHPLLPVGVSGTKVTIDGGYYIGSPAVSNGYNVNVKKGTFVDNGNTLSSFMVDPDSEVASITQGDGIKTTVVKESNPPINIDWGEFPMPDMTAPIISVTREPASTTEPAESVTITVNVEDPNGNDHETPISINGGAWQANGAKYTVTENQIVSIIARDSEGNIREYNVTIANIDEKAPEITGWTQSTDAWTADPVKVYVEATDDVKLADAPYKFTFTPDQPGSTSTATGTWQANRFIEVTGNGTVAVTVMDTTGKQTTDSYYVRNIDLTAPTATYTISPPEDIKASPTTGVTIELSPQNTGDPITQDGADMASNWIKWSQSESWTDNNVRTVYENGVYPVQVRDAVGNVGTVNVTITNVSTDKPIITSFTSTAMDKVAATAPVTLTVSAHGGADTPLHAKPYSWDGGKTWTSLNTHEVSDNGEYTVIVRDEAGTTAEASMIITNIDAIAPTAGVYLYKGLPSDFEGTDPTPDDYVWKIRVEASDIGSGIDRIETLWDSGVHTSTTVTQDVWEPGVYGAMIYDVAGNRTYAEKIVTAEAIGDAGSSDEYVPIEVPSTGSAGSHFNASINDLVYGPTGAYNKSTGEFKTYLSGQEGILVDLLVDAKRTTTVSGYATYNGMKYPVYFDGAETAAGASNMSAQVLIPIADIPEDINNGRLVVVVQEHDKRDTDTIEREGFATFYASVQITSPKITYQYSRDTNELMMQAISTVAGIKSNTYDIGAGEVSYTVPFDVGAATTITLKAVDNVGNATTEVLDADSLDLNGGAGGSLPTEDSSGSELNTYYISGRSAEVYIMGGTRNNTTNVPSSEVLEMILGTP